MGLWARHVLPRLVDRLCSAEEVAALRAEIVPQARGVVLEVGFGTGLNLPFYDPARVERVLGLEPAEEMFALSRRRAPVAFPVEHLALEGERIPLAPESVDTVLVTFTLCTIPDVARALDGMRRVLRRDGRLLFLEHGLARDPAVRRWQERVDPLWKRALGGCHLTRDVPALLGGAGFAIEALREEAVAGAPAIAAYGYRGVARPAAAS
jgi:ubiquinone/menaquinone biosynthesis C-methylase UbiE